MCGKKTPAGVTPPTPPEPPKPNPELDPELALASAKAELIVAQEMVDEVSARIAGLEKEIRERNEKADQELQAALAGLALTQKEALLANLRQEKP